MSITVLLEFESEWHQPAQQVEETGAVDGKQQSENKGDGERTAIRAASLVS
jgi:hypothetical protein